MAHTNQWDETEPDGDEAPTEIATHTKKLRLDARERMSVDHDLSASDAATGTEGQHKKITLKERIASPALNAGESCLFAKTGDQTSALRYLDDRGIENFLWFPGELQFYMGETPPNGWLPLAGGSIGSAASGATYANAKYEDLYEVLWDNLADAQAPVSGGRGANAAADFAANKKLTMPDARGRSPIGAGAGGALTARTVGGVGGSETKDISHAVHTANHGHSITGGGEHDHAEGSFGVGTILVASPAQRNMDWENNHTHGGATADTTVASVAGSASQDVMQPAFVVSLIIKY